MASNHLSIEEVKKIPLPDYLAKLGFEPAKIRGIDYWYHSPLHLDRTPSFKVNTKQNVWYDHGIGEGGTLIDLGIKLHQCTIPEFLRKVAQDNVLIVHQHNRNNDKTQLERPKVEILSVSSLSALDLIAYLNKRRIDKTLASQFCSQVEFRIGKRNYLAIGFPNRSGGFELRNDWFKGAASPKDITIIENSKYDLCVVEGFMDFLSLLKINQHKNNTIPNATSFLILNSIALVRRSIDFMKEFKNIHLFLDNDLTAKNAKELLSKNDIGYLDASSLYSKFKDVNEYLTNGFYPSKPEETTNRKSTRL
ncbi:MAG: toprim domain-containing protein [Cyclobacteriaceae bacterium]|nr:toprim domain-containing protein [Cyclobacteriaceae bacterium]